MLYELRLVCLSMDLLDNDVNLDDSEAVHGGVPYQESCDCDRFPSEPVFRWLSDVCVPWLLSAPK